MVLVWQQLLLWVLKEYKWGLDLFPAKRVCSYNFKNYIFDSPLNGTWILNKTSKPVIRALRTDFTKEILDAGEMDMTAMGKIQDLYFGGDMNAAPALSGQSVGLIDGVKSAEEIIQDTIKEFNETCSKLGNLAL